jgi:peptide/nickel transport system ATP-binding protein
VRRVGEGSSDGSSSLDPVLRVEDLRVHYETPRGDVKAVDGVSFALQPGERLGLIGESGSGKSTMAMALMRMTRPPGKVAGGRVLLEGRNLLEMSVRDLRRVRLSEITLVPQGAMNSLNPVMRIRDQIVDGILAHESRHPRPREFDDRVARLLERVGLEPEVAMRYPHELSGGMKQRAVMAIATALDPKVIVADEPTSALDVVVQRQVMLTLGQVQEGLGAAVVLIGHDMGLMAQFADYIGVMYAGKLVELGSVKRVLTEPRHPYTWLLIDSLPAFDEKRRLRGIPGLPPTLIDVPAGCPFNPRCPHQHGRCLTEVPELVELEPHRKVACHLYPENSALPPIRDDWAAQAATR